MNKNEKLQRLFKVGKTISIVHENVYYPFSEQIIFRSYQTLKIVLLNSISKP